MEFKRQRVLVINSCSKSKQISLPNQPHCPELETENQRKAEIMKFKDSLISAADLYTGQQALAIARSVKILKEFFTVDYFIISAGFGLVHESTLLPPYECSFSGKGKTVIKQMAKNLDITQNLEILKKNNYDLTYLALGKDYLTALGDLSFLSSISKQIIIFDQKYENKHGFVFINDSNLIKAGNKILNRVFHIPLGALIATKGKILENYATELKECNNSGHQTLNFGTWFQSKVKLLHHFINENDESPYANQENYESEDEESNIEYENAENDFQNFHQRFIKAGENYDDIIYRGSYDLSLIEDSQKMVSLATKKVSDKDLRDLVTACTGLRSINNKKGESRQEYVDKYEEYHELYRKLVENGNNVINDVNEKNGDAKTKIKAEYVKILRSRQEKLGLDGSLLNEVKYGFMTSMIKWLDNPKELKKKGVYRPRKEKAIRKSKNLIEPEINVIIKSKVVENNQWVLVFELENINNEGLQNLSLKFLDVEDEEIELTSVSGRLMEYNENKKSVVIPYIQASMEEGIYFTTKLQIMAEKVENFKDEFKVVVEMDYPALNQRIKKEFTF